jgi:hypothetical protein
MPAPTEASPDPSQDQSGDGVERAFIDLHCHTSASFDSLARPESVVRAAVSRGLTHLAITDHDRIDAALRVRDAAPDGLVVIVGEEVKSADGDLIAVFIEKLVPPGMSAIDTIAAIREQGGLVGVPHPFDRTRGYGRKSGADLADIAGQIDWIEFYNARVSAGNTGCRACARPTRTPSWKWASRTTQSQAIQAHLPACWRPSPRSTCTPTMPAITSGHGRRWPNSSNPSAATAEAALP